ncbi:hypothetical protein EDB84DRAFT_1443993 [Lactarius hengduanensis]|nr:hypothetical protein EDB84DRAFT_1443993 [Lactarius hengduanensis]
MARATVSHKGPGIFKSISSSTSSRPRQDHENNSYARDSSPSEDEDVSSVDADDECDAHNISRQRHAKRHNAQSGDAQRKKRRRSGSSTGIGDRSHGSEQFDELQPLHEQRYCTQVEAREDKSESSWKVGPKSALHPASVIDTFDRSSVEVEQILPPDEHVWDPRDFYASDSPVPFDFDSDQELYRSAEEFDISNDTVVQNGYQSSSLAYGFSAVCLSPSHRLGNPCSLCHLDHRGHQRFSPALPIPSGHGGLSQHRAVPSSDHYGVVPVVVGRDKADVDKVQGAEGLEKMCWPNWSEVNSTASLRRTHPSGRTPEPSRVSRVTKVTLEYLPLGVFSLIICPKMEYDDTQEMRKAIERAFTNRSGVLRSRHKREALSRADRASERSKHSRQQRKYQLFQRRRGIAKLFDPLKRHLDILDALGSNGMSSDESDVDCNSKRIAYTVVKPDWRHPDLHNWLKVFDQLHHRTISIAGLLTSTARFLTFVSGPRKFIRRCMCRQAFRSMPTTPDGLKVKKHSM